MPYFLGSGERVFISERSHIHEGIDPYIKDALNRIKSQGKGFIVKTITFDNSIGFTNRVTIHEDDEVIWARRINRKHSNSFVKNRQPEPSNQLTITLKKRTSYGKGIKKRRRRTNGTKATYALVSAFIGPPIDVGWNEKALIWGSEPIEAGSESTSPPPFKRIRRIIKYD